MKPTMISPTGGGSERRGALLYEERVNRKKEGQKGFCFEETADFGNWTVQSPGPSIKTHPTF
jgi:hypothetical protein